jgi:uroporphyrinogen decarboxylase
MSKELNLFQKAIRRENTARPPVWFMRQAGRYHHHYQTLKKDHTFIELCKEPKLACEVTMGPINDFGFDAAILFSDILFPLESMGMGLSYDPAPALSWYLKSPQDLHRLKDADVNDLQFQADAIKLIREALPSEKGLLGFVGGPLTLFVYAVEGSHKGDLSSAHKGINDGRFDGFCERLIPLISANMIIQAKSGPDTVAILETCAGDFSPEVYQERVVPVLAEILKRFKSACPDTPVTYYSKNTDHRYWKSLRSLPIQCLGIDWHPSLSEVLNTQTDHWAIQGNIDPDWLFLPSDELERRLRKVFNEIKALPNELLSGWVCGLGHGVLPKTPEKNVHLFLRLQKEIFGDRA